MLKSTSLVLLVNIYLAHTSLGLQIQDDSVNGLGGGPTKIQKRPYHCSIELDGIYLCSGVILNKKYVLTLADCLYGRTAKPAQYKIRVGSDSFNDGGKLYGVTTLTSHPEYNMTTNDYNVALVKIKGTLKFNRKVKKIGLADEVLKSGQRLMLTGWMVRKNKWTLEDANLKTLDFKECSFAYTHHAGYNLTNTVFCAMEVGKAPVMMGTEFGGPVVWKKKLYGIFSNCSHFGENNTVLPCLFSSIPAAAQWIKTTITK